MVQTVQNSVPQLQFIDVLLASLLWRRGRSLWSCHFKTKEIPLSQYINKEVDILVVLVVQVPQVQFLGAVDVLVAGHVRCWGRDIAENCGGSAVTVHRRGRSSWTRLLRCSLLDTSGVGVETLPKTVEVPQLQFIAMVVQYVDNVVDVPVAASGLMFQTAQNTIWRCRCCSCPSILAFLAREFVAALVVTLAVACSWLVLRVVMKFALCSLRLSAGPNARHHGRYGPEGQFSVAPRFLDVSRLARRTSGRSPRWPTVVGRRGLAGAGIAGSFTPM